MNKYNAFFFFCQYSINSETLFYTALTSNKILLHTGISPLKNCNANHESLYFTDFRGDHWLLSPDWGLEEGTETQEKESNEIHARIRCTFRLVLQPIN